MINTTEYDLIEFLTLDYGGGNIEEIPSLWDSDKGTVLTVKPPPFKEFSLSKPIKGWTINY